MPMSLGINTRITDTRERPSTFSRGKTLYVGGSGEGNYTRIQDAIDNASDGDTVFVYDDSSPYNETVNVTKSINLIGENKDTTVVDGNNLGDVFNITVDCVNISGFTLQKSGNEYGEGMAGIEINSQYNTITDNIITNNIYGIFLQYIPSSFNTISGNTITDNAQGIWFKSKDFSYNTITNNCLSNNREGIWLMGHNNTIKGNTISDFTTGISLHYSSNSTITNNIVSYNLIGILLDNSSYNTITDNTISENIDSGLILLAFSKYNTISGNTISLNQWRGIGFGEECNNNNIFHNNFINNEYNAVDERENTWDDGKYGNYWSDYKEKYPDAKKIWLKGIWDTPYEIYGGSSKDMCPLIKQWPNSLSRTMPRNRAMTNLLLLRFLEQFPILQKILNIIL